MSAEAPQVLSELALLRLLQLTSPQFPVGGFAYSQGLEQAVERRWVTDTETLKAWLNGLLSRSIARLDLPILARAYQAWLDEDAAHALYLSRSLHATRESRELVEEEQHFGSSLARALVGLGIAEAANWVGHRYASFPVLYALVGVKWNIPVRALAHGYAMLWLENQINAGSRLIPLGQLACQEVLSALLQNIPASVSEAFALQDSEVGSLAPAQAMVSAWHETQYSRLFRS